MSHLRRCGCVRRTRRPVTDMRGWGRRRQAGLGGWLRVEVQDLRLRWITWGNDVTSEHLVTNILQDFRLKIPYIKIPPKSRSVRSNLRGESAHQCLCWSVLPLQSFTSNLLSLAARYIRAMAIT